MFLKEWDWLTRDERDDFVVNNSEMLSKECFEIQVVWMNVSWMLLKIYWQIQIAFKVI